MTRGRPRQFDRDAALARAMKMFWADGYANTSVSDLTHAMNISPPSFYSAFGSKDALYEESLKFFVEHHGGQMWARLESTPALGDAIEGFLMASASAFSDSGHPPGCMVIAGLHEMIPGRDNDDATDSAAWLLAQREANDRKMQNRFKRAIAEGDAPGDFDCRAAADFVLTLQAGLSNTARLSLSHSRLVSIARLGRQSIEAMLESDN